MGERYRSSFVKADLIDAATVAVTAGDTIKLGEYQVPVGENIILGFGQSAGQESAEGRIYIDLKDAETTPGNVDGTLRITLYSPQNRPVAIVDEFRTETLRGSSTDRTKQVPYPERVYQITPYKKVVMEFISDADKTISKANSTVLIDITRVVA